MRGKVVPTFGSLIVVILAYVAVFTAVVPSAFSSAAIKSISLKDTKALKSVDEKYQKAKSVSMKIEKIVKIGLLAEERKSYGTLCISQGQVRLELQGSDKSLLLVNKKNVWVITYPPADFPDAPLQVGKGNAGDKKGQAKNAMSLLTVGGFLKLFTATAFHTEKNGERVYTLSPLKGSSQDFKKAEVTLTKSASAIADLKYWDNRDNETHYVFQDVVFDAKEFQGSKIDAQLFDYTPPKGVVVTDL